MNDYREYFDEVIEAHRQIEQWFAGPQPPAVVENLLMRFSPQFSMITPAGRFMDFEQLGELFRKAGGARIGLRIELCEMHGIDLHERGATLSYRELQNDATGLQTDRRSTVVFEKLESGQVVWRHLHETFCPA
ncbi:DUF4440 domain-containing protein [Pseudomonas gregormendelii]|uniref:DUF4440 domain-containing protein n=1 Tax=Pseudomonas gregormendelii TaxID=1628277 RepID=A0ABS3AHI8_9PSED|nr:DUF4440 domain-containing protein [Pseudomonas gregormendelii]MBN3966442.1 DUF4440 domain-containing protein [Pseudomonas gregormendelii]